ncbi:hypothetical protein [Phaeobacter sp. B1627]|uniref:hypothetical protein n=1 Tax=Phaeobacter sp. B1627 TaxID=2583809 RepID=UPI0021048B4A|nr:hypothetical protein [Phaeobacter sp. B1627]
MFTPDARLHALVCGTCGAPLSAQKQRPLVEQRPKAAKPDLKGTKLPRAGKKKPKKASYHTERKGASIHRDGSPTRKKKKSRKSPWKSVFEEVFDVIEDLFD